MLRSASGAADRLENVVNVISEERTEGAVKHSNICKGSTTNQHTHAVSM